MTADLYCSRADVNRELPLGSITSPSGLVASSVASTNAITYDGHGLETNDQVTVRAAEGGTLSAPLAEGTVYFARRITNATFELALVADGSAIDLTTSGVEMIVIREPNYDATIEFYSRHADAFLPAHVVPLQAPIHPTVKGIVARLTAKALLNSDGKSSDAVNAAELAANAQLERFAKGIPLRGAAVTSSANLAVSMSMGTGTDPRGYGSGTIP